MNRDHRPHPKRLAIVAGLLLLATVASVRAQTTDLGALQAAIERNEELLAEARMLVHDTGSAKARTALEAATRIHQMSREMMMAGNRPMIVARVVKRAREAILGVIQLARRESRLEENALRTIERASVRLEQAQSALEGTDLPPDAPPRRLVDEARGQLDRARAGMHEHLFGVALQLARASHDMATRALRMLRRDAAPAGRLDAELERTDRLIERAADALGDHADEQGRRAFDEARELQRRARRLAHDRHSRAALDATRRARRLARRIVAASGRGDGADAAERAERDLERTDELIAEARRIADESGADESLRRRLDRAGALQREARGHLDAGRVRAAMDRTRQARDLARRVLDALGRRLDADGVARLLDGTDAAIARAREAVADHGGDRARRLLEQAIERQRGARRAFDAGDLRRAVALTRDARDLARRAGREATGEMP